MYQASSVHTFKDFSTPCPVAMCAHDNKIKDWVHASCGSRMQINSLAQLRCWKHQKVEEFIKWKFACERHENQFLEPDEMGLIHSASILRAAAKTDEEEAWCLTLLESIQRMVKNKKTF